jgi:ArsR family transcriptional regulator, cadmium/lead-responsive transcriptional repressor
MAASVDLLASAVGDPTRRRVLGSLMAGEGTATEMARSLPVTRQAIAKHLGVLERAGMVESRRSGREHRFAVQPARLEEAVREMAEIASEWDRRLLRIKRLAEALESAEQAHAQKGND